MTYVYFRRTIFVFTSTSTSTPTPTPTPTPTFFSSASSANFPSSPSLSSTHLMLNNLIMTMQGTTSLRILDLEKEYKRRGVPSLAHESFASDGTVLGSYGASVRNGLSGSAQKDNAIHYADSARSSVVTENDIQNSDRNAKNGETEGDNRGENEVENEKEKEIIKEILGKKSARRQEKAKDKHNVHISRQQLRNLLMKNIPSSNVVWGKHFSHYVEKPDRVELCFHDGTRFEASVLVAADGIYSTIRKQLIPQKEEELQSMSKGLNYLNLMVILGISPVLLGSNASVTYPLTCIPPSLISVTETETVTETGMKMNTEMETTTEMSIDTDLELNYSGDTGDHGSNLIPTKRKRSDDSATFENNSYADVTPTSPVLDSDYKGATGGLEGKTPDPLPSRSQCQWLDGSTRVFTMPFDQSHTMWQLSFPCTEEEAYKLTANPVLLKEKALERCKGWHDPLVTLLSATDVQLVSGHPAYDRDPLAACDLQRAPREKTTDSERDLETHSTLSSSPSPPTPTSITATASISASIPVPVPASAPAPAATTTAPVTPSTPLTSWTLGQYSRVTLLGDAAHPMSPFKAQGANQALMDAISLSDALGLSELTKVRWLSNLCVCACVCVYVYICMCLYTYVSVYVNVYTCV